MTYECFLIGSSKILRWSFSKIGWKVAIDPSFAPEISDLDEPKKAQLCEIIPSEI
jgi:hypothetical protein